MATVNKTEVVGRIAATLGMPKAQVAGVFEELADLLADSLSQGDRVRLTGLATFSVRETSPRRGRNPRTGKPIMIPLKRRVHTSIAKKIKDRIALGVYGTALLVSEGDPAIVGEIREGLEAIGYSLGTGHNVEEGLKAVQARPEAVDFIVVGPFVSDEDYDELTRSLKVNKRTGGLPIARAMATTATIDAPSSFKILPDAVFDEATELVEVVAGEQERWREEKHYFVRQLKMRSPSNAVNSERVKQYIERLSEGVLPDEREAYLLASAFKEAFDNAAVHGNGSAPDKYVEIHFYEDRNKITFEVADEGEGFEFQTHLADSKEAKVEEIVRARESGDEAGATLGIKLMAVCADEVEYFDGGSRVKLTKMKP